MLICEILGISSVVVLVEWNAASLFPKLPMGGLRGRQVLVSLNTKTDANNQIVVYNNKRLLPFTTYYCII
jgi:hypothetical protein